MQITYQLKDKKWREMIDLRKYKQAIKAVIQSFPMIELINITEGDYTIEIKTGDSKKKDRIVRAFGHALATETSLCAFARHNGNSNSLFIAK